MMDSAALACKPHRHRAVLLPVVGASTLALLLLQALLLPLPVALAGRQLFQFLPGMFPGGIIGGGTPATEPTWVTNCKNGVQHSVYDTNIHYCATPAVSSWSQCESNCRELGTWSAWGLVNWGMVTPCTATMNNLLLNLANGWFSVAAQAAAGKNMALDLGASDTWEEGVWKWWNVYSLGSAGSYTQWASGEPNNNNGNEDVGMMFLHPFWNRAPGDWNDIADTESQVVHNCICQGGPVFQKCGIVTSTPSTAPTTPTATADSYTVNEDATLTVTSTNSVVQNDVPVTAGNTLTATLVGSPAHAASFSFASDGTFTYQPAADYAGTDSFTYKVTEGSAVSNTATVTITVAPQPDAPRTTLDVVYANRGITSLTIRPLANDVDVDGDALTIASTLPVLPTSGSATVAADGLSITYTPTGTCPLAPPASGSGTTDSITYTATDNGHGGSTDGYITVILMPVNAFITNPQVSLDVLFSSAATDATVRPTVTVAWRTGTGPYTVTASYDVPAAAATPCYNPAGAGVATPVPCSVTGMMAACPPAPGYTAPGVYTVCFEIVDAGAGGLVTRMCAVQQVTITAATTAIAMADSYTVDEDATLTVSSADSILNNDVPATAGNTLTATLVGSPAHAASFSFASDGTFTYQPAADYFGTDSFTYTVTEGSAVSNTATVTITVAPQPDAPRTTLDVVYANRGITSLTIRPLANDVDVDGDALTIASTLPVLPTSGSATVAADGLSITYTPTGTCPLAPPASGSGTTDSITYTATDNGHGGSTDGYITVILTPVNAFITNPQVSLDVFSTSAATDSTVRPTVTVAWRTGTGPYTVTASYDVPAAAATPCYNPAGAGVAAPVPCSVTGMMATCLPAPGYTAPGVYTVCFEIMDAGVGGGVTRMCAVQTVTVFGPPVATDDSYTVDEDATLTVSLSTASVLANDLSSLAGSALTSAVLVAGSGPAHAASFSFASDGTFTYQPAADYAGADSFQYKAVRQDGAESNIATVTITVAPQPDAPRPVNDAYTFNQGTIFTISPLANDVDVDGDALTIASTLPVLPTSGSATVAADGLSITYAPVTCPLAPSSSGSTISDSITYTATDNGHGGSTDATIALTLTPVTATIANPQVLLGIFSTSAVNDATVRPTLTVAWRSGSGPYTVTASYDVPAAAATPCYNPAGAGVAAPVTCSVTGMMAACPPAPGYSAGGVYTVCFEIVDAGAGLTTRLCAVQQVTVIGNPIATADSYSVNEDTSLAAASVLANDSPSQPGASLTAVLVAGTGPAHAASFSFASDGTFTYRAAADWSGSDSFQYKALQGALESDVVTVTITVVAQPDAPRPVNDAYTFNQGTIFTISPLANDVDADGDALAIASTLPVHPTRGTAAVAANGLSITYTPADPWPVAFGGSTISDSITYTATDNGHGGSTDATIALTLTPVTATIANALVPLAIFSTSSATDASVRPTLSVSWQSGKAPFTVSASYNVPTAASAPRYNPAAAGVATPVSCTVGSSGKSATCLPAPGYSAAGVYTVCFEIADADGLRTRLCSADQVVVYDPSAGYVVGQGKIHSPAGALVRADVPQYSDAGDIASFSFMSKYQNGGSQSLIGVTYFTYQAGNMKFISTSYDFLVVSMASSGAGGRAQYAGTGTLSFSDTATHIRDAKFRLTALDSGAQDDPANPSRRRMQIWRPSGGGMVYDNNRDNASNDMNALKPTLGTAIVTCAAPKSCGDIKIAKK